MGPARIHRLDRREPVLEGGLLRRRLVVPRRTACRRTGRPAAVLGFLRQFLPDIRHRPGQARDRLQHLRQGHRRRHSDAAGRTEVRIPGARTGHRLVRIQLQERQLRGARNDRACEIQVSGVRPEGSLRSGGPDAAGPARHQVHARQEREHETVRRALPASGNGWRDRLRSPGTAGTRPRGDEGDHGGRSTIQDPAARHAHGDDQSSRSLLPDRDARLPARGLRTG